MKMKRIVFVALLCLVLCVSLFPVAAFADQTLIIIGGPVQQSAPAAQSSSGTTVMTGGGGGSAVVVNGGNSTTVQSSGAASGSVIVMPNGSVVSPQTVTTQPAQTVQTTVPVTQNTNQNAPVTNNSLLSGIYKRINEERTKNGLGILGYDTALQMTADIRAKESSESFGHTRPDGSAAVTAVTVDYYVAGENLIQVNKEYASVDLLVDTWLASDSHRANIMLADFTQTALGIYESNGIIYISQIFTD